MIKLSFLNLFRRKTRTLLSVSGIIIGVAAIIVLVSLVDGFTQDFDQIISQYKGITVYEKNSSDVVFSQIDASLEGEIESLPYVKAAIPEIWLYPKKIDGRDIGFDSATPPTVYGLDIQEYYSSGASGWITGVEKGSLLDSDDSGVVLVGKKIADNFQKFAGSAIKIDGKTFKVKGILEGDSDFVTNIIVMNIGDARDLSTLPNEKLNSFTVTLKDFSKDTTVAKLIELKWDNITAYTQAEISEQVTGIIGNLRLLAIFVALISSLVAGIGIANTMLMSVFERFREIGALKAVGWTNENIIMMVLYESFFLGVFGGVLGVLAGFLIDVALESSFGIKYAISAQLIIFSFMFAVLLGVVSGIYPAYRASKLDPVEALRG